MKNIFYISLVSLFALNIISCAKDEEHSSTSTTTSDNTTSDNTTSDNTPELFVTWGNSGTILTSSDNGTTWDNRTTGTSNHLYGVSYGQSTFVGVGASGTIITSSDGTTWDNRTSGTSNRLMEIRY